MYVARCWLHTRRHGACERPLQFCLIMELTLFNFVRVCLVFTEERRGEERREKEGEGFDIAFEVDCH